MSDSGAQLGIIAVPDKKVSALPDVQIIQTADGGVPTSSALNAALIDGNDLCEQTTAAVGASSHDHCLKFPLDLYRHTTSMMVSR